MGDSSELHNESGKYPEIARLGSKTLSCALGGGRDRKEKKGGDWIGVRLLLQIYKLRAGVQFRLSFSQNEGGGAT